MGFFDWLKGSSSSGKTKQPSNANAAPNELPSEFGELLDGEFQYCNMAAPNLLEYRLKNPKSFSDILKRRDDLKKQHPNSTILLSYDDLGQACYTSFHCVNANDLGDCEYDADGNIIELQKFSDRLAKYWSLIAGASFEKTCEFGSYLMPDEFEKWQQFQCEPFVGFDDWVEFVVVPDSKSLNALASFPNGYFTSDWGPREIFGAVEHLQCRHAYDILAIGASYLLLERKTPTTPEMAGLIAQDFVALYNVEKNNCAIAVENVADLINGKTLLCLKYTNS